MRLGKARKTKTTPGKKKPNKSKPETVKKLTGKPPKVIKMLVSLANSERAYTMGHSYNVPADVSVGTARSWVADGVAEKVS